MSTIDDKLNEVLNIRHCNIKDILPDQMILDIGDKTISNIMNILIKSKTILWNGPLGAFEKKPFDNANSLNSLNSSGCT